MRDTSKWPSLGEALRNIEAGVIDDSTAVIPPFDLEDQEIRGKPEPAPEKLTASARCQESSQMTDVREPSVTKGSSPGSAFQQAIIAIIDQVLQPRLGLPDAGRLENYFVLRQFGLDVAVFLEWPGRRYEVKFLEAKAFVGSRRGGVGFGNGRGEDVQIRLLFESEHAVELTDHYVRWIFADGTREVGSPRYAIFTADQARRAAMGEVQPGKQNNLSVKTLREYALTWAELKEQLETFLLS